MFDVTPTDQPFTLPQPTPIVLCWWCQDVFKVVGIERQMCGGCYRPLAEIGAPATHREYQQRQRKTIDRK